MLTRWRRTPLLYCLAATSAASLALGVPHAAAQSDRIQAGEYVTVEDGHLTYNGQRLRLWGTNIVTAPKRAGDDLVLSFDRMVDAGFNGVRVNLVDATFQTRDADNIHSVPVTEKGSGSTIDRMDHAISLARERGMFFWLTFHVNKRMGPGDYDVLPDAGDRDRWLEMASRVGNTHLVYLDDRAERAHQEFARALLEHENPYTGRRYADEETIALYEVFNENSFVSRALAEPFPGYAGEIMQRKWNQWLRERYGDDDKVTAAWGKLEEGESLEGDRVVFAPTRRGVEVSGAGVQREYVGGDEEAKRFPYARGEDIVRFVVHLYQGHTERFIRFVRGLGKPGRGISVVPITPSGEFGTNLQTYWGAACGDFISMGLYGFAMRPWSVRPDDPFYPFVVRVNQAPLFEQPVDLFRAKGKPYVIYECNDHRPNPYTVEFRARIVSYAVLQDLDGVFWFNWDDAGYLHKLSSDEDYVNSRMPMADSSYPNASLVLANDETALAALKAAGTLFRSGGVPPATAPADVTIGRDLLLNLGARGLGGLEGKTPLESLLRAHVWRRGMRVEYAPEGQSQLPDDIDTNVGHFSAGPHLSFNWEGRQGHIRIDAPSAKLFCGFLRPHLDFDGVRVTQIDRNWGFVSLVAEDGKPLPESRSVLVTAISRGRNRGFQATPERLSTKDYWQQGLAQMTGVPGTGPPIVDRVAATIKADWLKGLQYEKHDFARKCFETGRLDDSLTLRGYEPLFYARLTRPEPVLVRRLLVMGHSIVEHGPAEHLGWKGHWGMAATAREKDWAHVLRTKLEAAQGGAKVELVVENLLAPQLAQSAESGRFRQLAEIDADLVLIQIGDNLPKDKATEETLTRPYEQLLLELKRAKPDVFVFGLSTWGACAHRNELMRKACGRHGAGWIYISHLIGDEKNRAVSEGHFANGGVNWHPGDRGMEAIADTVLKALQHTGRIGIRP